MGQTRNVKITVLAVTMDAWTLQSILFAVQTTNDPGITAGIAAIGGAAGYIALGAGGIGRYVLAFGGQGRYLFTQDRRDREAVELFCRWLPRLREYVHTSPN